MHYSCHLQLVRLHHTYIHLFLFDSCQGPSSVSTVAFITVHAGVLCMYGEHAVSDHALFLFWFKLLCCHASV